MKNGLRLMDSLEALKVVEPRFRVSHEVVLVRGMGLTEAIDNFSTATQSCWGLGGENIALDNGAGCFGSHTPTLRKRRSDNRRTRSHIGGGTNLSRVNASGPRG